MNTDDALDPMVSLDEALQGIMLLESLVDIEKEEMFEQLTEELDMYQIFRIYSQLCMLWLITESESNNQSYTEYIQQLRRRMIDKVFHQETNGDDKTI